MKSFNEWLKLREEKLEPVSKIVGWKKPGNGWSGKKK
jgi:hypothetical protein